jgi:hypothetical protein
MLWFDIFLRAKRINLYTECENFYIKKKAKKNALLRARFFLLKKELVLYNFYVYSV